MNLRPIFCVVVLLALSGGCAHETREPSRPAQAPANVPAGAAEPAAKLSPTLNPSDTDVPRAGAKPPTAGAAPAAAAAAGVPVVYTCPHHPKVMQGEAGECPYCGMKLVPTNSRNTSPVRGVDGQSPAAPATPGGESAGPQGPPK
jgi:hypothetical protein